MTPDRSRARRGALAVLITVALLVLPALATPAAAASPGRSSWEARQIQNGGIPKRDRTLAAQLPGQARLGYHPGTGRVRVISGTPGKPLAGGLTKVASGRRLLTAGDARSSARRFLGRYGQLFGLKAPGRELRVTATQRRLVAGAFDLASGTTAVTAGVPNATVRFEQVRGGIPVMGGEIVVQLGAGGQVLSASGEVLPSAAKTTKRARVTASRARKAAAIWLARESDRPASAVRTRSEGLALYDPRVMDDPLLVGTDAHLVWRIDARLPAKAGKDAEHRLVLVEARGGQVITTIGRVQRADRAICDNRNRAGKSFVCRAPFTRREGDAPRGNSDIDSAYRLMGVTRDYFGTRFGRNGIDGKGSRIKATVRYCAPYGCPWRGAEWKWAEQQAIFGKGWARADDIVAHELTHGVLDAEAPLFYHYQSGAINESFADVFGELIDLSYSGGKDTASTKWKIGEDSPIGAFRDMRNPTRHGHPDRVRSPRWHTGVSDDGGVHRNSGVGNKAAYLMAAGGNFRGYRIKGIGQARTARVWYQALTTRLTSAANYIDLADALTGACTDLAGSGGITFAHCRSVRQATEATQMNRRPLAAAPRTAPLCPAGKRAVDLFNDDLENPRSGRWARQALAGGKRGWYWPQNPNDSKAWDGSWSSSGRINFYAPDRGSRSDRAIRMRDALRLPAHAYLRFEHGYSFDRDTKRRYDGGIVQIQVGAGPWRSAKGLFTHGGYNGTIAKGYRNPLAGVRAYTGNSRGWSQARLDLSRFAGKAMRVRFRAASDRAVGGRGWYIDDVRVYTCTKDTDRPTGAVLINGDAASTNNPHVSLALSYADASTWVTRMRVSNSPVLSANGAQLKHGISMDVRETLPWDLSDTTFGGNGRGGLRRVHAQVRDATGRWSKVFSDQIELIAAP